MAFVDGQVSHVHIQPSPALPHPPYPPPPPPPPTPPTHMFPGLLGFPHLPHGQLEPICHISAIHRIAFSSWNQASCWTGAKLNSISLLSL